MKNLLLCLTLLAGNNLLPAQDSLRLFSLRQVRLLPGIFEQAQQSNKKYLLTLPTDHLPDTAERSSELPAGQVSAEIGSYLSALSAMFATTGDSLLYNRIFNMLAVLESGAQTPAGQVIMAYDRPYLYKGLTDAFGIAEVSRAGTLLLLLANRFHDQCSQLDDQQLQQLTNSRQNQWIEVLADLYSLTNDEKFLKLARRILLSPRLSAWQQANNVTDAKQAKSLISEFTGLAQLGVIHKNKDGQQIALEFWQHNTASLRFSTGGLGIRQSSTSASDLSSFMQTREGPETCLSAQMLRLTKTLFLKQPDARLVDYYERTLYNNVLPTLHPEGGFACITPVRPGLYKAYTQKDSVFSCCIGAGMINPAYFGEMIYARNATDLYVNLFIPSVLNWTEKEVQLTQRTSFPEGESIEWQISCNGSKTFRLFIRYPEWLEKNGLKLMVNKNILSFQPDEHGYVMIDRTWKDGDLVRLNLPMSLREEALYEGSPWISFLKGPIVLAAKLTDTDSLPAIQTENQVLPSGPMFPLRNAPLVIKGNKSVTQQLKPVKGLPLSYTASFFSAEPSGRSLLLKPFYSLHNSRYFLYWREATPTQLDSIVNVWKEEDRQARLQLQRTIDEIYPGSTTNESDHAFRDDESFSGYRFEQTYRAAKNGFGYLISNASLKGKILRLTLEGKEKHPGFDVWIDDAFVQTVQLDGTNENDLMQIDLPLPENKLNLPTFRIRFTARNLNGVPPIYTIRLLSQ